MFPATYLLKQLYLNDADLPATAQIICIPVEDGYSVLAVYLAPDPVVDAVIAREGWPVAPVDVYREPWEAALTAG